MKRLLVVLAAAAALWSAACGSGSAVVPPPPPAGKFSLASLNGAYAFVTNGEVFTGGLSATPLARVGSFTADGKGGITGGVEDLNEATVGVNLAVPITGGSYTVNADGRGTLTLLLGQSSINFGITLTSINDGLMIDETSTSSQSSTGSGNFIKQQSGSFAIASVAGSYVFDFSGLDATQGPDSIVGQFAVSGGPITTGVEDVNDNGAFTTAAPISGNFAADGVNPSTLTGFGRGIAQINGVQYVFYIVDSTRLRFLSTTGGAMLAGDAVAQTNNVPTNVSALNSGFVFIVAGSSANGGVTRVGRFTANGASVTNVFVDTNNAGAFHLTNSTTSASISLDSANPGRGTVTFTDPTLSVPFTFVFYLSSPTSGVIQDVSQSSGGNATDVADGSMVAQSGSPFSSSNIAGTYALNWSGLSVQQGSLGIVDEEDLLAQATVTNLALSGTSDIFQFTNGVPVRNLALGGTIAFNGGDGTAGDGKRSTMSVIYNKTSGSTVNSVVYFANPQLAFFANNTNTGTTRVVAGILKAQQ